MDTLRVKVCEMLILICVLLFLQKFLEKNYKNYYFSYMGIAIMHSVNEKRSFWQGIVYKAFFCALTSNDSIPDSADVFLNSNMNNIISAGKRKKLNKDLFSIDSQIIDGLNECHKALETELDFYHEKDKKDVDGYFNNIIAFFHRYGQTQVFFPQEKELEDYLDNYYCLLKFLFENITLLHLPIQCVGDNINTISEFLSSFSVDSGETILSPYLAESILKFYKSLRRANKSPVRLETDKTLKK